jgi:hypothetical protein
LLSGLIQKCQEKVAKTTLEEAKQINRNGLLTKAILRMNPRELEGQKSLNYFIFYILGKGNRNGGGGVEKTYQALMLSLFLQTTFRLNASSKSLKTSVPFCR